MGRGTGLRGAIRLEGFEQAAGARRVGFISVAAERRLEELEVCLRAGDFETPVAALDAAVRGEADEAAPPWALRALVGDVLDDRVRARGAQVEALLTALGREPLTTIEHRQVVFDVCVAVLGRPTQTPLPGRAPALDDIEHGALCSVLASTGYDVLDDALATAWGTPAYRDACARLHLGQPADDARQRKSLLGALDHAAVGQVWSRMLRNPRSVPHGRTGVKSEMARHALQRARRLP